MVSPLFSNGTLNFNRLLGIEFPPPEQTDLPQNNLPSRPDTYTSVSVSPSSANMSRRFTLWNLGTPFAAAVVITGFSQSWLWAGGWMDRVRGSYGGLDLEDLHRDIVTRPDGEALLHYTANIIADPHTLRPNLISLLDLLERLHQEAAALPAALRAEVEIYYATFRMPEIQRYLANNPGSSLVEGLTSLHGDLEEGTNLLPRIVRWHQGPFEDHLLWVTLPGAEYSPQEFYTYAYRALRNPFETTQPIADVWMGRTVDDSRNVLGIYRGLVRIANAGVVPAQDLLFAIQSRGVTQWTSARAAVSGRRMGGPVIETAVLAPPPPPFIAAGALLSLNRQGVEVDPFRAGAFLRASGSSRPNDNSVQARIEAGAYPRFEEAVQRGLVPSAPEIVVRAFADWGTFTADNLRFAEEYLQHFLYRRSGGYAVDADTLANEWQRIRGEVERGGGAMAGEVVDESGIVGGSRRRGAWPLSIQMEVDGDPIPHFVDPRPHLLLEILRYRAIGGDYQAIIELYRVANYFPDQIPQANFSRVPEHAVRILRELVEHPRVDPDIRSLALSGLRELVVANPERMRRIVDVSTLADLERLDLLAPQEFGALLRIAQSTEQEVGAHILMLYESPSLSRVPRDRENMHRGLDYMRAHTRVSESYAPDPAGSNGGIQIEAPSALEESAPSLAELARASARATQRASGAQVRRGEVQSAEEVLEEVWRVLREGMEEGGEGKSLELRWRSERLLGQGIFRHGR